MFELPLKSCPPLYNSPQICHPVRHHQLRVETIPWQTSRWSEVSRLPPGCLPSGQWGHSYLSFVYFPFILTLVSIMWVYHLNSSLLFSKDFCFIYGCILLVSNILNFSIFFNGFICSFISFK